MYVRRKLKPVPPTATPAKKPTLAGRHTARFLTGWLLAGLLVLLAGLQPVVAQTPTPTVTTDKPDYGPTEIPKIFGLNFVPNTELDVIVLTPKELQKGKNLKKKSKKDGWDTLTSEPDGSFFHEYTPFRERVLGGLYEVRVYNTPWNGKLNEEPLAMTTFTDGPPKVQGLEQCQPGPNDITTFDCTSSGPDGWKNGNNDGPYFEGDTVPYRSEFKDLLPTTQYRLQIEWDTSKGGKHALDYLRTFNATVLSADPCVGLGVGFCSSSDTFPIPSDIIMQSDPEWIANSGIQASGDFTLYNGTIDSVSIYTLEKSDNTLVTGANCGGGGCYDGDTSTYIDVFFTTNAIDSDLVLAWGGHIASRDDWGDANSAAFISGSPFHMRLNELSDVTNANDLNVGNTDRSLSAGAVIFPGFITITKAAFPFPVTEVLDSTVFNFTFTGSGPLGPTFTLTDETSLSSGPLTDFTTYTVAETSLPADWELTDIVCVDTSGLGFSGTIDVPNLDVDINLLEGQVIGCTFTDVAKVIDLELTKSLVPLAPPS